MSGRDDPIVWIAGVGWDDTPGTDRRLVTAIAERHRVLWVDPPRRDAWGAWIGAGAYPAGPVAPNVERLRVPAPPGFTRWPVTAVTAMVHALTLDGARRRGTSPRAVVLSHPLTRFPRRGTAPRVLYLTDDWVAGAGLMGLDAGAVRRTLAANARRADVVAAVTAPLIDDARALGAAGPAEVIPNGAPQLAPRRAARQPVAGVVGQLNERLDLALLEGVVAAGVSLRLIGPRADRDAAFGRRLDALIGHERVEWTGPLAAEALRAQLAVLAVGLTPYTDSPFNRASFPLKTLEYLAAGVPVVSSDLAASRWIDSPDVTVAATPDAFVRSVRDAVGRAPLEDAVAEAGRVALAHRHRWEARADDFLRLIASAGRTSPAARQPASDTR
ncbi:glycosyltransferase [Microbacterium jiangjiandongii]|uniref:glycosyltransferase n=1 Tax=Microbacterium jiangjiandongii TaxID=3049071 RepID=UPI00214CDC04|nr:glycosyltransferase [Microbacterium sp. zg.Y843]MCR2815837.1 glycosyltransferase [Microbacterium sp. zg.Y843]